VSAATPIAGLVRKPHWSLVCDSILAGSVAAFALWTVLYEGALVFGLRLVPAAVLWLILSPGLAVVVATANVRHAAAADRRESPATAATRNSSQRRRLVLSIPLGLVGAALMSRTAGTSFEVGWALVAVATILVSAGLLRSRPVSAETERAATTPPHGTRTPPDSKVARRHLGAATIAMVVGVGSLFLYKTSGDDTYYINLSAWIADHGRIPLRDTMFGNQVVPSSYGGAFPVSSIEGLIGALARLLDIRAGSVAYFVVTPICALASIWVLWQLAQLLAPRWQFTTFFYSLVFVGVSASAYGSYSAERIWQGKVIAVAVLVPLIWVLAIRLLRASGRHWSVMMFLAGIAFLGLTSSGAIMVPVISASFLVAAALLRRSKLAWGAILLAVAPAVSGLVLVAIGASVGGKAPAALPAPAALHIAFGSRPALACVSLLALTLSPLLVRDRGSACLVWCSALGVVVAVAPGVFGIVNAATGAGQVAWRMLLGTPLPSLVGLFAATGVSVCLRWARRSRIPAWLRTYVLPPLIAVALACLLGIAGTPVWRTGVRLFDQPVWKVEPESLANVKAVLATDPPNGGPLLLPPAEMSTLAIYTTQWFAVVPRELYIASLPESAERSAARYILFQLVTAPPLPTKPEVKWALGKLGVSYICVERRAVSARRLIRSLGFEPFVAVGTLVCTQQDPS
jgi:hypothetical protein